MFTLIRIEFEHIIDSLTFQWDEWICCAWANEHFPIWRYHTDRTRQMNVLHKTQQVNFLFYIDIRHILTLRRLRLSPRAVHVRIAEGVLCLCLGEVSQWSNLHRVRTLGAQPLFDRNELWGSLVVVMQIYGAWFEDLTAVLLRRLLQDASVLRRAVQGTNSLSRLSPNRRLTTGYNIYFITICFRQHN